MACPNCKMSLGWAQAEYEDPDVPWYKPTEQVVRCKYCGVRFKAEPKYFTLSIWCLVLAAMVFTSKGFVDWGKWVIGLIVIIAVFLTILDATRPYMRID